MESGKVNRWVNVKLVLNGKEIGCIDISYSNISKERLQADLLEAEAVEDYERCAEIRDRINKYFK